MFIFVALMNLKVKRMIQILVAIRDYIKSTGNHAQAVTKVGTYANIVDIKITDNNQVAVISYVIFDKTYSISCRVKDIDYVGVYSDNKNQS